MNTGKEETQVDEIGCIEAINGLYAYLDGEMGDEAEIARFEHHLSHCRVCCSRTELEAAIAEFVRKVAKGRSPETLQDRLRKLIDGL